eukprot:Unigene4265_Nuclearia_a/m.12997 Unigene4265_Nuclearia_a/g.12997  ORF Unigene4265_Nuclearia_a/g.12997 Unigene4265_Nuclearia_a/m.12997 type:complete len:325 (+) Unigene4265_Nuclearia_a:1543-2517(+)
MHGRHDVHKRAERVRIHGLVGVVAREDRKELVQQRRRELDQRRAVGVEQLKQRLRQVVARVARPVDVLQRIEELGCGHVVRVHGRHELRADLEQGLFGVHVLVVGGRVVVLVDLARDRQLVDRVRDDVPVLDHGQPRVAQQRLLRRLALLGLAPDVVEREQDVVLFAQIERDGDLDLLVERRRLVVEVDRGPRLGHERLGRRLAVDGLHRVGAGLRRVRARHKLDAHGDVARRRRALVLVHVEHDRVDVERVDVVDLWPHDRALRELLDLAHNLDVSVVGERLNGHEERRKAVLRLIVLADLGDLEPQLARHKLGLLRALLVVD